MDPKNKAALFIGFGFFQGIIALAGIVLENDFPTWLFITLIFMGFFFVEHGFSIYINQEELRKK